MKARVKGTDEPFRDIETVEMKGVCGIYFANDVEFEPTPDHWQDLRERAAMMALPSIIPMQKGLYSMCDEYKKYNDCAEEAIRYADALIKKLKGE